MDCTTQNRMRNWTSLSLAVTQMCAVLLMASTFFMSTPGFAQEVWCGRDSLFVKEDYADWTLAENQDHITDAVWITRANSQGIFNIQQENAFGVNSPLDTEWAAGNANDWESLTFQSWLDWVGSPPSAVGQDAVVHLISEDIYVDIRFLSWTEGAGGHSDRGGGFSYLRAKRPDGGTCTTPVMGSTWGQLKVIYR